MESIKSSPVPTPTEQPRAIDTETLIARFGGNPEIAKKILAQFLPSAQDAATSLCLAATEKNWRAVEQNAHKIAGGAKTIAAFPLGESASAIEQALRDNLPDLALSFLPRFQKDFDLLTSEIHAFLN